jgi:hypothetical protein
MKSHTIIAMKLNRLKMYNIERSTARWWQKAEHSSDDHLSHKSDVISTLSAAAKNVASFIK